MRRSGLFLMLAAAWLMAAGCGDDHDHGDAGHPEDGHAEAGHHEGGHGSGGGTVSVPDQYSEAVRKCEEISKKIGALISSERLSEVHAAAADITKIAEKLPELAQKDLKPELLKEVNIKAKELAGMFNEIDEAADSGNKAETIKLHTKMKALIAELVEHAGDGHDHGHEKHH